jgi:hypothetical protein
MKRKEYCVECGKTLRNYKQGDKRIHRKCWMLLRDKSERHFDHLFCKDKKIETMKKSIIIHPIDIRVSPLKDDTATSSSPTSPLQSLSLPPQKQS